MSEGTKPSTAAVSLDRIEAELGFVNLDIAPAASKDANDASSRNPPALVPDSNVEGDDRLFHDFSGVVQEPIGSCPIEDNKLLNQNLHTSN